LAVISQYKKMNTDKMKASVNTRYGAPEVLEIKEISKPIPKEHEVLIKVHASTVNRTDCGFRKPEYLIVRLIAGLLKPTKQILGSELAGEIEAVGAAVKSFKTGDKVFGLSTFNFGTHAEYVCVAEKKAISTMDVVGKSSYFKCKKLLNPNVSGQLTKINIEHHTIKIEL
jgi:NADPH:quinone reductase-like Zn-dependent oxidoreductase